METGLLSTSLSDTVGRQGTTLEETGRFSPSAHPLSALQAGSTAGRHSTSAAGQLDRISSPVAQTSLPATASAEFLSHNTGRGQFSFPTSEEPSSTNKALPSATAITNPSSDLPSQGSPSRPASFPTSDQGPSKAKHEISSTVSDRGESSASQKVSGTLEFGSSPTPGKFSKPAPTDNLLGSSTPSKAATSQEEQPSPSPSTLGHTRSETIISTLPKAVGTIGESVSSPPTSRSTWSVLKSPLTQAAIIMETGLLSTSLSDTVGRQGTTLEERGRFSPSAQPPSSLQAGSTAGRHSTSAAGQLDRISSPEAQTSLPATASAEFLSHNTGRGQVSFPTSEEPSSTNKALPSATAITNPSSGLPSQGSPSSPASFSTSDQGPSKAKHEISSTVSDRGESSASQKVSGTLEFGSSPTPGKFSKQAPTDNLLGSRTPSKAATSQEEQPSPIPSTLGHTRSETIISTLPGVVGNSAASLSSPLTSQSTRRVSKSPLTHDALVTETESFSTSFPSTDVKETASLSTSLPSTDVTESESLSTSFSNAEVWQATTLEDSRGFSPSTPPPLSLQSQSTAGRYSTITAGTQDRISSPEAQTFPPSSSSTMLFSHSTIQGHVSFPKAEELSSTNNHLSRAMVTTNPPSDLTSQGSRSSPATFAHLDQGPSKATHLSLSSSQMVSETLESNSSPTPGIFSKPAPTHISLGSSRPSKATTSQEEQPSPRPSMLAHTTLEGTLSALPNVVGISHRRTSASSFVKSAQTETLLTSFSRHIMHSVFHSTVTSNTLTPNQCDTGPFYIQLDKVSSTTIQFHWIAPSGKRDSSYTVSLTADNTVLKKIITNNTMMVFEKLYPGDWYTVSVEVQSCGKKINSSVTVRTEATEYIGTVRITNKKYIPQYSNKSSTEFKDFQKNFTEEVPFTTF
ncbi:mucin-2-like [Anolis carolinensis]|uniref:mucin-2-like n=1 Tax=Anolis carolinensis TaxID=28377 RepID=UPI002F2B8AB4